MEAKHQYNFNFLMGMLLGGVIGGFTTFVLGTKEGSRFAEELIKKAEMYEKELEKKISLMEKNGGTLLREASSIIRSEAVKEITALSEKLNDKNITSDKVSLITPLVHQSQRTQEKNRPSSTANRISELRKRFFKKNGKHLQK